MKKILLALVMIAASVFLAQTAVAGDENGGTDAATGSTSSETTEQIEVEQPPPAPGSDPAEPAPVAPAPAAAAPADNQPADDSAGKAPSKDSAGKAKQGEQTDEEAAAAGPDDKVVPAAVKVWVCKYVGTPGEGERLKEGKQPIEVSSNALPGQPDNLVAGQSFTDQHGRSYVVQVGGDDPGAGACPAGDEDTEVDTEDPIVSPGTCQSDGALTLPETAGVLYTVTPNYTGDPGTYDVVATALDGYVLSDKNATEWDDLVVEPQDDPAECITDNPGGKKVWVCKYVGKPGVDEVLKGGKNPIEVNENALPGAPVDVSVGDEFSDAQERSVVVALSPADPEPTENDCPGAIQPEEVTPEAPTVDPATCEVDGSLTLPETEGVVYAVAPDAEGAGTYVVTATPLNDDFTLIGQTVFEVTVDEQLQLEDCVASAHLDEDDPKAEGDELLPDTGGLPLWILLVAGPMTAAGVMILMRRQHR
ncbi:hypothetical protein [Aeromicrobium sp.]|uniref:hypothetical protein n=1 Tax=Aeromicrobium sp. TaxID=1871063 RepID=UPI002FCC7204